MNISFRNYEKDISKLVQQKSSLQASLDCVRKLYNSLRVIPETAIGSDDPSVSIKNVETSVSVSPCSSVNHSTIHKTDDMSLECSDTQLVAFSDEILKIEKKKKKKKKKSKYHKKDLDTIHYSADSFIDKKEKIFTL